MNEPPIETLIKRVTLLCKLVTILIVLIVVVFIPQLIPVALVAGLAIALSYIFFFVGRAYAGPLSRMVRWWFASGKKQNDV